MLCCYVNSHTQKLTYWSTLLSNVSIYSILLPCFYFRQSTLFVINECSFLFLGRFDMNHVLYRCLQCKKDLPTSNPVIITQLGFWPGSVTNMTYVFDPEVFLHWDLFQKESPGCSERSYLKSLEQFSVRKGRVWGILVKSCSMKHLFDCLFNYCIVCKVYFFYVS